MAEDAGRAADAAQAVSLDDFAGSDACAACHAEQYESWASSTHGRAGGEASPETVIAPFDGEPIALADGTVTPRVDSLGRYLFQVERRGVVQDVHVDGVVGGGHMLGGGTQGFVGRWPDGTVRFLPFDWSRQLDAWFCNTGSRAERGWVPMGPELALADCGDWPPLRVLGTHSRFANCQSCHGSQIVVEREPGRSATTRWSSLDVNCESCHGPARRHVELARTAAAAGAALPADVGVASRVVDDVETSLETCLRCHALKDVVREGYLPGLALTDHYALKLPILGDDPYTADGRVKTFAYQGTHLSSSCYVDGAMTCVSCHEPHALGYWDVNRAPLEDERDDRQCTSCHASKATRPEEHTRHAPGSAGSECVSCHMPYLQHPEVGDAVPFARSDHTIPIPRPALDARMGLVSACRTCHADLSELRLQATVERWWGSLKPLDPVSSALLAVNDRMGEDLAARMLLQADAPGAMARFQGLARFLEGWVRPGQALGAEAAGRVEALSRSDDLDLRALALAALHAADGDGRAGAPPFDARAAAGRETLAVRRRWVMVLGHLSDEAFAEGRAEDALELLDKAQVALPGDAGVLRSLGLTLHRTGDHAGALEAFAASLAAEPNQPLVHVNAGVAHAAMGDAEAAAAAYAAALGLNPDEALAHFNLGNLHLRAGRGRSAIASYERAVALAPELARAQLNLAIALAAAGRVDEALPYAERAVDYAPADETARRVLADLRRGARSAGSG